MEIFVQIRVLQDVIQNAIKVGVLFVVVGIFLTRYVLVIPLAICKGTALRK